MSCGISCRRQVGSLGSHRNFEIAPEGEDRSGFAVGKDSAMIPS